MSKNDIPPSPQKSDYVHDPVYQAQLEANAQPMFDEQDPYALFAQWLAEARQAEPNDPNAMSLASVDQDGVPDVRMVLLKSYDDRGFVFYSHEKSAKGIQLKHNPHAALNFHWKSLRRQVRIRGSVTMISKAEVGAYFSSRARSSQIGAWASRQSQTLESRETFETLMDKMKAKFKGVAIPLPPGWKGWRVQPQQIEFWRDKPFRLHDRLLFSREDLTSEWTKERLYP
jgi:pyridoxamine 5'-phosphate oxidase